MITSFVLMMMLVIDYLNVQSKGAWNKKLQQKPFLQIFFAAILGIIPGCLGAFTVVSLFTHRVMSFAALVTAMISTFGDEAFVMFAMMPEKALILSLIVFVIAIITGMLILFVSKFFPQKEEKSYGFEYHDDEQKCICFPKGKFLEQLKTMGFERALLISGLFLFSFFIVTGKLGGHEWDWKRITFLIGSLFVLFIVSTVPEHFIKEHLWGHVIKKHLPRIFLWTFGAFVLIYVLEGYLDIEQWISNNVIWMLVIAVLIGIIPESGPHLLFLTLFINGTIPFSILIASSIVQDGHGALPLLAESRKSFIYMKGINIIVGFIVGFIGLTFF
ncbi:MAG: arsenic efflux protein [Flavobacteriaceae bacterium]|nr:arsenic efflux protein [Flavobacteriaceae bacterium]